MPDLYNCVKSEIIESTAPPQKLQKIGTILGHRVGILQPIARVIFIWRLTTIYCPFRLLERCSKDFFLAGNQLNADYKQVFGVVSYSQKSELHLISLAKKREVGFVNLTANGCSRLLTVVYSSVKKYAFMGCGYIFGVVPFTVDVAKQRVIRWKDGVFKNVKGWPRVSPDGKYLLNHDKGSKLNASKINSDSLYIIFLCHCSETFDVKYLHDLLGSWIYVSDNKGGLLC